MPDSLSYRDAGVDIDAAAQAMRNVKETVRSTFIRLGRTLPPRKRLSHYSSGLLS